jgi:hypothetical protein
MTVGTVPVRHFLSVPLTLRPKYVPIEASLGQNKPSNMFGQYLPHFFTDFDVLGLV